MWSIEKILKLCSIISFDLVFNKYQIIFTIGLLISCTYSLSNTLNIITLEDLPDVFMVTMARLCIKVLAVTTVLSRIALMYHVKSNGKKYKTTLKDIDLYSPMTAKSLAHHKLYSLVIISVYLFVIFPINLLKFYFTYQKQKVIILTVFILFVCMQNLNTCSVETYFVIQIFRIYLMFREINDDLIGLKHKHSEYDEFLYHNELDILSTAELPSVIYNKDFYKCTTGALAVTNMVELLRIRHWLAREAVDDLNHLFGIQLVLTVVSLGTLALHDTYHEVFYVHVNRVKFLSYARSILLYGLIFQYSFRICIIALTAHVTTKQALKAKSLITDINNRYLDNNTKEELQLFLNQISSRAIEFTACDFFTLNTHLITSTISILSRRH
ncbi:uncharacterized protein LOC126902904 isoform X2 [Daktulosphaira vitifoliae]|uniref:uncharacterized protein LOC126902904 isoform X2 n=1 Tax=Daktulosphaira vitifoliae TaxID=58002 RepID=UPI0021A9A7B4|nr:uncharacterized protein LOC126902904 isoform X2 [Daktulosphaira vitifoliae]